MHRRKGAGTVSEQTERGRSETAGALHDRPGPASVPFDTTLASPPVRRPRGCSGRIDGDSGDLGGEVIGFLVEANGWASCRIFGDDTAEGLRSRRG